MSLWDDITSWLHAPFTTKQDPVNWVLVIVLATTIAYFWARILDHVLEE